MSDISPAGYAALHVPRSLSADREAPSRGGGLSIVYREYVVVRRNRLADEFRPSTCVLQLVRLCSSPSLAYALPHLQTTVDVYCLVDVDTCVVPRTRTRFGDRSFSAAGPRIWNSLPPDLRRPDIKLGEFRRLLKTFLFV